MSSNHGNLRVLTNFQARTWTDSAVTKAIALNTSSIEYMPFAPPTAWIKSCRLLVVSLRTRISHGHNLRLSTRIFMIFDFIPKAFTVRILIRFLPLARRVLITNFPFRLIDALSLRPPPTWYST